MDETILKPRDSRGWREAMMKVGLGCVRELLAHPRHPEKGRVCPKLEQVASRAETQAREPGRDFRLFLIPILQLGRLETQYLPRGPSIPTRHRPSSIPPTVSSYQPTWVRCCSEAKPRP